MIWKILLLKHLIDAVALVAGAYLVWRIYCVIRCGMLPFGQSYKHCPICKNCRQKNEGGG